MWKLFKIKKLSAAKQAGLDNLASVIAKGMLRLQRVCVNFMANKTSSLSPTTWKRLSILCTIVGVVVSSYLMARPFLQQAPLPSIYIMHLQRAPLQKTLEPAASMQLSAERYHRIKQFHHWMDSLHQHASSLYDSVLMNRPGLMDSVQQFEKNYQQKN